MVALLQSDWSRATLLQSPFRRDGRGTAAEPRLPWRRARTRRRLAARPPRRRAPLPLHRRPPRPWGPRGVRRRRARRRGRHRPAPRQGPRRPARGARRAGRARGACASLRAARRAARSQRPRRRRARVGRGRAAPGPGRPAGRLGAQGRRRRGGRRALGAQRRRDRGGRRRAGGRLLLRGPLLADARPNRAVRRRGWTWSARWRSARRRGRGSRSAGSTAGGSTRCWRPGHSGWSSSGRSPRRTTLAPQPLRWPRGCGAEPATGYCCSTAPAAPPPCC